MTRRKRNTGISRPRGLAALCILAALGLLAGCNRSPNVLIGHETTAGGIATQLNIENSRLQRKIAIDVNADARRVNGALEVNARLTNRTKKTRSFEYKFLWYDQSNFEISRSRGNWTPMTIDGRENMGLQATAPTPEATSFKLQLRFPQTISE